MLPSSFVPNRTRALPPKLGDCALLDGDLYAKCHQKCHFVLIKARMIAIGPYVVVFWTLSQLVLVRKGCDVAFGPYSQSNKVEQAVTCSCVHQSPGHHASRRQISHQGSTQRCKGSTRVTETRSNMLLVVACTALQARRPGD